MRDRDALGTAGRDRRAQPPLLADLTLDARSAQGHMECLGGTGSVWEAQGVSEGTQGMFGGHRECSGGSCSFGALWEPSVPAATAG